MSLCSTFALAGFVSHSRCQTVKMLPQTEMMSRKSRASYAVAREPILLSLISFTHTTGNPQIRTRGSLSMPTISAHFPSISGSSYLAGSQTILAVRNCAAVLLRCGSDLKEMPQLPHGIDSPLSRAQTWRKSLMCICAHVPLLPADFSCIRPSESKRSVKLRLMPN